MDRPDSFRAKQSIVYKCQAIGDLALAPVRYLFHGSTVRIEEFKEKITAVDHVASFYSGVKTNESRMSYRLDSGQLRSSKMSYLRTALAIICLIPGCLCALFFKLPFYYCAQMRAYQNATQLHFTAIELQVGKTTPITNVQELATALQEEVDKTSPLYRVVNNLIIHTQGFKLEDNREDFILLSPVIESLNPEKLIFIKAKFGEQFEKALFSNLKWTVNPSIKNLEEALGDPLPRRSWCGKRMHRYYVL